jgi:non-ribosomal peptide synthetase component F
MAGRPARLAGVETMIGLFINTLPLRTEIGWDEPVLPWLKRLQDRLLAIRDQEHVGLFDVQRWSEVGSGNPLFDSFVVFENYPIDAKAPAGASGLRLRDFSVRERSNFPLTLVASPGARLHLKLVHTGADAQTAPRLLEAVQQVLTAIAADSSATLSSVALLSGEETREQTEGWNAIDRAYPAEASIASLVSEQAASRSSAVAVQWGSSSLTYGALETRTNQVARYLRRHGVHRGAYVALMVERGPQLIVGMLAILKAGGAYVPLDPDYPAERLAFMLDDTAPPVLLAERKLLAALPPAFTGRVICLDDEAAAIDLEAADPIAGESTGSDAAYVMYTSGSTGRPKGVCVPQHAITRLVWQADFVGLRADDVVAQASNASFDAATFEIWGALINGARLVGVPRDIVLSPESLGRHLAEQGITTLFLTTALFNQVAREHPAAFACLHHLLFGGEAVDPRAVDAVLQAGAPRRLLHVYGPTENTTFSTWYQVHADRPRDHEQHGLRVDAAAAARAARRAG